MSDKKVITLGAAKKLIKLALFSNNVPMLHGSPAIGKSSIVAALAAEANLKLIDIRLSGYDSTDMNGLVNFNEDRTRAEFVPMGNFPLAGDPLPLNPATGKPYNGWLIILDELPSAERSVLAASYKLILDRMVGMHNLHEKAWLVAAGNMDSDGAIVNDMGTALMSRMVNLYLRPKLEEWMEYAIKSAAIPLDYRIQAFLEFRKDLFYSFSPSTVDDTFPAPRTWSMLNSMMVQLPEYTDDYFALVAGTIGVGAAREFQAFQKYFKSISKYADIVKDPKRTKIPTGDPGTLYALAGMLGKLSQKADVAPVLTYVARMPTDFQMITLRGMIASKQGIENTPEFDQWVAQFNGKIF